MTFLKSYYRSSTFICSDTFGRCCILQMMQHFVWFGREETALFAFEATLRKVFHASLHCLSPLPPAGGAYPSCRCARATWKDIQPLTLTHTPTGNLEFFNCPHMYVFGLCEEHANSTQKGLRPRYETCNLLTNHYTTVCS